MSYLCSPDTSTDTIAENGLLGDAGSATGLVFCQNPSVVFLFGKLNHVTIVTFALCTHAHIQGEKERETRSVVCFWWRIWQIRSRN